MIRDPSDGTVREKPMAGEIPVMPVLKPGIASGLPKGSTKPKDTLRLEASREWLKQYRKAADDLKRMNDKGEIPQAE